MSSPRFRARLAVAVGLLLAMTAPAPAWADHGHGWIPDDEIHYVDEVALTANGNAASDWGQSRLDQTQISTPAGTNDVEVRDYESLVHAGAYAWTECPKWWPHSCDKYLVGFNQLNLDSEPLSHWQSAACHEFGHTAGLLHRFPSTDSDLNSCMQEFIVDSGWSRFYDQHDINEINGNVPPGDDDSN